MASVIDRWLKKYHYSLDEDFMPYILEKVRDQVPRALKVILGLMCLRVCEDPEGWAVVALRLDILLACVGFARLVKMFASIRSVKCSQFSPLEFNYTTAARLIGAKVRGMICHEYCTGYRA